MGLSCWLNNENENCRCANTHSHKLYDAFLGRMENSPKTKASPLFSINTY